MIYKSDKKVMLYKGDCHPVQLYKGSKKAAVYETVSIEGERELAIKNTYNDRLYNAKIYGNCIHSEEPSPENPVDILCVGDLVKSGEHEGKYRIKIAVYNEKRTDIIDVYLDAPLRKVGRYEDYIDFEDKTVVRNTVLKTFEGTETWYRDKFRVYTAAGSASINSLEICLMTDRFEAYSWEQLYTNSMNGNKYIGAAQQAGYICITPATVVPAADEWKAQLALWKSEGKPLTVVYAGNTVKENISLPEIPTFSEETYYEILTDINANISGEYNKAV